MIKLVRKAKGFTLIELLVVIGLIGLLAAVVLIAVNPARQFALGRNSQRSGHVNSILNSYGQNVAENQGTFTCAGAAIPACSVSAADKTIANTTTGLDLAPCFVPKYISAMLMDPKATAYDDNGTATDYTDDVYNTNYTICKETNNRITVTALGAEEGATISQTR
jgi:prepilin-type N-terminal cleavage/methylation domain-containing protein